MQSPYHQRCALFNKYQIPFTSYFSCDILHPLLFHNVNNLLNCVFQAQQPTDFTRACTSLGTLKIPSEIAVSQVRKICADRHENMAILEDGFEEHTFDNWSFGYEKNFKGLNEQFWQITKILQYF